MGKANATVVVTAYNLTYDGDAHTATYTVSGVGSDPGAAGTSINVTGTTHTPTGTYNGDPWSFNGGNNYNDQSGTVDDHIGKANATVVVTAYNVTYDGHSHTATYTVSGVGSDPGAAGTSINVTGTTHTPAGTYNGDPWSFNGGNNYNDQSGTVDDHIGKANATVVVTAYNVTYDGHSHTATYTITGVNGETGNTVGTINVSGTTHTNAGAYNNDPWNFTGGANYNNQSGTVNDVIAKANATFTVTPYNVAFDNNPHTATIDTITGVNGETGAAVGTINLSGTTHTLPGDYPSDPWTFTGTANYNNRNGTVHDIIHYGTTCSGSDPGYVILPPINTDGSSVYKRKAGSTIPVKFKVCDANGNSISDPYAVFLGYPQGGQLTMTGRMRGTVDNINETGDTIIPDVAFQYTGGKWQFNMATTNLDAGYTYTFRINLAYGAITFTVGTK